MLSLGVEMDTPVAAGEETVLLENRIDQPSGDHTAG